MLICRCRQSLQLRAWCTVRRGDCRSRDLIVSPSQQHRAGRVFALIDGIPAAWALLRNKPLAATLHFWKDDLRRKEHDMKTFSQTPSDRPPRVRGLWETRRGTSGQGLHRLRPRDGTASASSLILRASRLNRFDFRAGLLPCSAANAWSLVPCATRYRDRASTLPKSSRHLAALCPSGKALRFVIKGATCPG
jgi:hypothetical protein